MKIQMVNLDPSMCNSEFFHIKAFFLAFKKKIYETGFYLNKVRNEI